MFHLIVHGVVDSQLVTFRRPMEIRLRRLIYSVHYLLERRAMAIRACAGNSLEKDVGMDHLVQQCILQIFRGPELQERLGKLYYAASARSVAANSTAPEDRRRCPRVHSRCSIQLLLRPP
jgi:hypothetical protein